MFKKHITKKIAALTLMGCLMGSFSVEAASTSHTHISTSYGNLTGNTSGYIIPGFEKGYNASAKTTKPVSRIRARLSVCYKATGKTIGDGENTGWIYNSDSALTCDYEMHHFNNALTGKRDGFLNTTCVAYGTADAITDKAYVVYTSYTL